uniref:Sulfotransferase domain-containing protein n=1 Tax=Lotharella oceanica TaxID=641309 RepID=A0A7S2U429_9EUKA
MDNGLLNDGVQSSIVGYPSSSANVSEYCLGVLKSYGLSVTDPQPQKRKRQHFYVEHVMKCGGSALCYAFVSLGGCSRYYRDIKRNCRIDTYREVFRKAAGGLEWDSANITSSAVKRGMVMVPNLCGVVFNEPGWMHRHENNFGAMERYRNLSAPFWDAYTTVLVVRDPWDRYYSHVRMLKLFQEQDDSDMSDVENLVNNQGPFDDDEMRIASTNFLTQHLVPEFRHDPSNCTQETIRRAVRAVNRFDHVFNFFGDSHVESEYIMQSLFGVWIDDFKTRRVTHRRPPSLSPGQRRVFEEKNQCDLQIISHVNKMLHRRSRCLNHVFPFNHRQRHSRYCGVFAGNSFDMRC